MKYTFMNNFTYLLKEQIKDNKIMVVIFLIRIFLSTFVSLLGLLIPRLIIDSITENIAINSFLMTIVPLVSIFVILENINILSEILIKRNADIIRYNIFVKKINKKAMTIPYELSISAQGKTLRKKAESSIGGSGDTGLNSFFPNCIEILRNILGFVIFSIVLIQLHWTIVPILGMTYLITYFLSLWSRKNIIKYRDEKVNNLSHLEYFAYRIRNISFIKEVKLYEMYNWINQTAKKYINMSDKISSKIIKIRNKERQLNTILYVFIDIVASIFLINILQEGQISIGNFVFYLGAIKGLGEWFENIVQISSNLFESNEYVKDFREFEEFGNEKKLSKPNNLPQSPYTLRFENVSYRYPNAEKNTLENLNFEFQTGKKIAIVGNNGAGKTTLIKLVSKLIQPTSGKIYLNDIDLQLINDVDYFSEVSAVFQDIQFLPTSIEKNVSMKTDSKSSDIEKVWESLRKAGLSEKIKTLPNQINTNLGRGIAENAINLSIGENQKLMMARAMFKKAKILILDEPTASLDPIAEQEVYEKYNELSDEKTLSIFISHRLASTRFCDTILFLNNQTIEESGSHSDLMKMGGNYTRLFNLQSYYYQNESKGEADEKVEGELDDTCRVNQII